MREEWNCHYIYFFSFYLSPSCLLLFYLPVLPYYVANKGECKFRKFEILRVAESLTILIRFLSEERSQ